MEPEPIGNDRTFDQNQTSPTQQLQGQQFQQQPQFQQNPYQQIPVAAPETKATLALVLSILGLLGSFFYGFGICFAIPSLILANGALAITNQYPNHPDAGSAKAAKVISWIAIAFFILAIVTVVLAGVLYVWAASLAETP